MEGGGGCLLLLFILRDLVYCALSKCQHCQSNPPIKPNPCCWALPVFISADRRAQSPHASLHPPIRLFTRPSLITFPRSPLSALLFIPYRSFYPLLRHILYRCWCFLFCLVCLPSPKRRTYTNVLVMCVWVWVCVCLEFVLHLDLKASPEELDFLINRPYVKFLFQPLNSCPGWQWADAVQPRSFYQR